MARLLSQRLWIEGTLRAQTPLHIGGPNPSAEPLTRDGSGRWLVPGAGLAGPIREWCARAFGEPLTSEVWGSDRGSASRALLEDAPIALPDGSAIEVRESVAIDRRLGSATAGTSCRRAIVPRGSTFPLRLELEIPALSADADRVQGLLGHLLNALEGERIAFGAAKTRGFGRVKLLPGVSVKVQPLDGPAILDFLDGAATRDWSRRQAIQANAVAPREPARLTIQIEWRARGPVMVRAKHDDRNTVAPLLSGAGEPLALVLPGSSIKGALRSQAERIVRTVSRRTSDDEGAGEGEGENQAGSPMAALPLIGEIFGVKGERIGALSAADCYAKPMIPRGSKPDDADRLAEGWRLTPQGAIDRWTGGAVARSSRRVVAPRRAVWDAIELDLDLERLGLGHVGLWKEGLALVLLTLRELADGRVPLGCGVNRGMGEAEVAAIQIRGAGLDAIGPEWEALTDCRLERGQIHRLPPAVLKPLQEAWGRWVRRPAAEGSSRRGRS